MQLALICLDFPFCEYWIWQDKEARDKVCCLTH
jgi:hypothetical protein